ALPIGVSGDLAHGVGADGQRQLVGESLLDEVGVLRWLCRLDDAFRDPPGFQRTLSSLPLIGAAHLGILALLLRRPRLVEPHRCGLTSSPVGRRGASFVADQPTVALAGCALAGDIAWRPLPHGDAAPWWNDADGRAGLRDGF